MKTLILRTNRIDPDPRVEKEANTLLAIPRMEVSAVVWDRGEKYHAKQRFLKYDNGTVWVNQFGIPAAWGGGMKRNLVPMIAFEWRLFWWLVRHLKEYDIVHACDLLTGLPAMLPRKIYRKKMVYDIFDYYAATQTGPKALLNLFSIFENHVINQADATIICSEKRIEQISGSKPRMLSVIHNAPSESQLDVQDTISIQSSHKERIRVVYVGNLVSERYLLECIEAIKPLSDVELHIGGYGALEHYIADKANELDNVFFYGKLDYNQVIGLERQCDIMVALYDPKVPNHLYAAPNKFYEALALGRPLIMFKNTGMDGIIEENNIGVVCEDNIDSLRSAIKNLADRKGEFPIIAQREKELFKEQYSWSIMENRLRKLYADLMGEQDK